jgi:hypothetical protein
MPSIAAYHPAMPAVLGAIVALELTKFYGLKIPFGSVGKLIEVNLLTMNMQARKVLRVPRCSACSSLNSIATISLSKNWFGFVQSDDL